MTEQTFFSDSTEANSAPSNLGCGYERANSDALLKEGVTVNTNMCL